MNLCRVTTFFFHLCMEDCELKNLNRTFALVSVSKKCAKKNYFVIIINEEKHRQVCRQDNWLK